MRQYYEDEAEDLAVAIKSLCPKGHDLQLSALSHRVPFASKDQFRGSAKNFCVITNLIVLDDGAIRRTGCQLVVRVGDDWAHCVLLDSQGGVLYQWTIHIS